MTERQEPLPLLQGLHKSDYDIHDLDDEIRVDRLCVDLLRHLYQDLTVRGGMTAAMAGAICRGADHFLREFIIGDRQENLFSIGADRIRQFAGHWYIIRTPEPSIDELRHILAGTTEFYRFLACQNLLNADLAEAIANRCDDLEYYRQRIEDFWTIENGGYEAWRRACPLEQVNDRQ